MNRGPEKPPRPPTARQLALAADIAQRFLKSTEMTPEESTHVHNAVHLMGMAALRKGAAESV